MNDAAAAAERSLYMKEWSSRQITAAAVRIAITETREDEEQVKKMLLGEGIKCAAIDYGGEFLQSIPKILERAVVAAKREGVIGQTHAEEGAVAGATHEAISEISERALGLNIGGKIAIARGGAHVAVCVFFAVGLLNLNDVAMGIAHRVV